MKLVQKILSHGLLIAFFVAVFFIYLYRIELFPQWFAKDTHRVAAQQAPVVDTQPAPQDRQVTDTVVAAGGGTAPRADEPLADLPSPAEQPAEVTQTGSAAPVPESPPTPAANEPETPAVAEAPAAADSETPGAQPQPVQAAATGEDAAAPGGVSPQQPPPAQPQAAGAAAPETAAPPTAAAPASDDDFQLRLQQAREFFWRRDYDGAVQAYRGLTESFPGRAEAWGELGNLYFNQRQTAAAADAYSRAIGLLIERGDTEQAGSLLGVMYRLDAEKANELEKRLRQAGS